VDRVAVPTSLPVDGAVLTYSLVVDPDLGDPIGAQILSGEWQLSAALLWLLSVLRPGDGLVDLGAHLGTFTVPAALLGARVVAVEGSPRNASVLRAACAHNHLDDVEVVEAVVDSTVGEVDFVDLGPYGTISTGEINAEQGYPTIRRTTTTVDDLPGGPFTWAKIDIEGKEQAILGGARRTLGGLRGMVVESNGYMLHSHGTSPHQTVRAIEDAGRILRPLSRPFVQPETIVDYVAVAGEPPVPSGWEMGPERSTTEIVDALLAESRHPIREHRDHAARTIERLPRRMARLLHKRQTDGAGDRA
jgi:FkbM family methyltransferase